MSDNDIGKGQNYDRDSYRDPDYPGRPKGGFIEERLDKIEHKLDQVTDVLGNAPNGIVQCMACHGSLYTPIYGTMQIPLCTECAENLGRITLAKKGWLFK